MKAAQTILAILVLSLATARFAQAAALTDYLHTTNGGNWNNDNNQNWAIWFAAGNTTGNVTAPTFLNDSPTHNPLGVAIPLPTGTSQYTLYKADNGTSTDATDVFTFSVGASTGTITLTPDLAYLTSNTAPSLSAPTVMIGNEKVTISGFNWYAPSVFNQNFVGSGDNITPDLLHGTNDVGLLTITTTPEPSSMLLAGVGAIGLFIVARRRRKA